MERKFENNCMALCAIDKAQHSFYGTSKCPGVGDVLNRNIDIIGTGAFSIRSTTAITPAWNRVKGRSSVNGNRNKSTPFYIPYIID